MNISSTVTRVMASVGVALFMGVGAVAAAPYSHVNTLPERTTQNSVSITFDYLGSGGSAVTQVDLYVSKDNGPFTMHRSTTDVNAPIVFDFTPFGDGHYAFFTIAHTANGEVEIKNRTEANIIRDATAPAMPKTDKIFVNEGVTPDLDTVKGNINSVESYARVEIFSDSTLKALIASANATDTGEWGPLQIGDNTNNAVWIVAVDANGNRSAAARVENRISYDRSVTAFHATAFAGDRINLDYAGPTDSHLFVVEYKHTGGSVWSARILTTSTSPELVDLEPGRSYDIRVAPITDNGNVGVYVGTSLRTPGAQVGPGPKVASAPVSVGGSNLSPIAQADSTTTTTTTTTTPAPATDGSAAVPGTPPTGDAATTTDKATAPDSAKVEAPAEGQPAETGDSAVTTDESAPAAEAAQEEGAETKSSATPWVVLAILIILAGIATGGYFYWFSGPEEVTTTVKPEENDKDKRW